MPNHDTGHIIYMENTSLTTLLAGRVLNFKSGITNIVLVNMVNTEVSQNKIYGLGVNTMVRM